MDDLTSKLREIGYVSPPRDPGHYSRLVSCGLMVRAADEIERLRSAVAAVRQACEKIADALKHDGSEAIYQDYDQGFEDGVAEVANRIRARSTPDAKGARDGA